MNITEAFLLDQRDKPRSWHRTMLEVAFTVAKMSKDPKCQVGAVVVSPDKRRVSFGYNGFPSHVPDINDWWQEKVGDGGRAAALAEVFGKNDLINHAELNAILQARTDLDGWTLYCTYQPCLDCSRLIVTAGIKFVYFVRKVSEGSKVEDGMDKAEMLLKLANVDLFHRAKWDQETKRETVSANASEDH
ncbi:hypothetical protein LCGC14_0747820 [marine sediment metagenome]|uniref:CMP/dCMP-type deaminase domain-containing protein n=1 Tax=marine sediment metagenome TaxID=412755 RepID=A0A0F9Q4V5_9ZZZZ